VERRWSTATWLSGSKMTTRISYDSESTRGRVRPGHPCDRSGHPATDRGTRRSLRQRRRDQVDGGRDLDLARRGRSARCTRGGLAAGDAGRTRECDVGILVERSRSTAPKQIAAKVRESGTTPTEIAVIGPPVGATILGEVATSKGSGPGPPFPRCRERPRWLVLGALCRAECLPHRGEATPPHLRLDHRVAGWIARGIADGDQPSMAGWTDAPHAHATRGPLRRRRTRVHRRLERVPGRARGQDPDTARDLSGWR
jgi:hypothetical protein